MIVVGEALAIDPLEIESISSDRYWIRFDMKSKDAKVIVLDKLSLSEVRAEFHRVVAETEAAKS